MFLVLLLSVLVTSGVTFADTLTTKVSIAPSLRITIPTNTLTTILDPSDNAFDSEDLTVTVATNHQKGFKLYLDTVTGSGGTTGTNLVNVNDSTKYIETLSSSTPQANFPVNKWGYRISSGSTGDSSITDLTGTNYFPYASHKLISSSTEATNGVSSTLDFASKVDYEKPAGRYSIAMNFEAIPIITNHYMQEFATDPTLSQEICTDKPTIIMDQRDEQAYMIQRLADGHCWMLDNLNLDLTDRDVVNNLTNANTNIAAADSEALTYLKNGGAASSSKYATTGLEYHNWTGSGMTPESPNYSYTQPLTNRSGKCDPNKNSSSPCAGKWQDANYMSGTILDTADTNNTKYDYGPGGYMIGTYYNFCAASAGSYCYDNSSGTGDATSDICPAGWHIPSDNGGNNGDYLILCTAINGAACNGTAWNTMAAADSTSLQYQLSTPISGRYSSGTAARQGEYGFFWSSSYHSATDIRGPAVTLSGVLLYNPHARNNGFSVRCVSS